MLISNSGYRGIFHGRVMLCFALISLVDASACCATTYRLIQPSRFDSSPFGFSGSLTTDGSTGLQATTDFIESWSITIQTPATVDGISTELLTPSTSTISLDLGRYPGLTVTPEFIYLPMRGRSPNLMLSWLTADGGTQLSLSNRATNNFGVGVVVNIFDTSEPNSGFGVFGRDIPLAAVVPEPAGLGFGFPAILLLARRRLR